MDILELVDMSRRVKGAVTFSDADELLKTGTEVFILINTEANLAVVRGTLVSTFKVVMDDDVDIELTLEFIKPQSVPVIHNISLGKSLNGESSLVGDEKDGNLSRIFVDMEDSIKYFEQVQFTREVQALEKTSTVNSLISRLLTQRNKNKDN